SSKSKAASQPASAKKSSSKPSKPKRERVRDLSVDEKFELSERINHLSSSKMHVVTKMIREGVPRLVVCIRFCSLYMNTELIFHLRIKIPMMNSSSTSMSSRIICWSSFMRT